MENIERLTELQKSIGYVPGSVSPVALLGLMGEVGEVSDECGIIAKHTSDRDAYFKADGLAMSIVHDLSNFEESAKELDDFKKKIRFDGHAGLEVAINDDGSDFDVELSDVFYNLNAIAIGRGLTLDDLARISYEKVMRKRATIGPEILGN